MGLPVLYAGEGSQSTLFLSGCIASKMVPAKAYPTLAAPVDEPKLDRLLIVGLEASYRNLREEQLSEFW
jgi:hypothetical protein